MEKIDKIIALEERLAHILFQTEELSEVVVNQAERIQVLEKQMKAMMEMMRDAAQAEGSVTLGDQPPPHW
ncbi:MAG: SlyX family protein [Amylibacter sp.]|nr:SlyX family protein [Amylibacter sp.]